MVLRTKVPRECCKRPQGRIGTLNDEQEPNHHD